ncbi:hypothetical protein PR202_ga11588 [Eleusine coracana subsp. coracana]|uniref:Helicase ATP-binding domain-containing protein n=1 Tax=Eleusine coracana subsp. coracana TaxID=191504 RepID=A0AAV5C9E0_ELECO|nr:hypothetical protein PR202_ga11588 [Eleusine coracana subsp. coracana]
MEPICICKLYGLTFPSNSESASPSSSAQPRGKPEYLSRHPPPCQMPAPPPPPPPRQDFPAFPFTPYPIQRDFMSFLYGAISSGPGSLALLESPTGTGKTLSIICSALQWLVDHRAAAADPARAQPRGADGPGEDDEPDWMRDFTPLSQLPEKETRKKKPPAARKTAGSAKSDGIGEECVDGDEGEFLLEEYESDSEDGATKGAGKRTHCGGSSSSEGEDEDAEEEEEVTPKVYFTSRTHSQLSQFVGELKRTEFGGRLRTVCLGSRKNLCINKDVLKLRSVNRINDRCLEMQKNKKNSKLKVEGEKRKTCQAKTSCGCPMLRNRNLQKEFRSEVLDEGALDIEDLARIGKRIGTCPYYGSRSLVRSADLIVLPYQSLLLKSARESLGINLRNSVVIIDEAHNLADSLTSMYNSKVTSSQVILPLNLPLYDYKFGNLEVQKISFIVVSGYANKLTGSKDGAYQSDLQQEHKDGAYQSDLQQEHDEGSSVACFQALADFLRSLVNCNDDGRIIVAKPKLIEQTEAGYLKFVMLSAEKIFSEVLFFLYFICCCLVQINYYFRGSLFVSFMVQVTRDAYAVILAGGTLQPIEETRLRLCPSLPKREIKFFTCNHIVSPESILPISVTRGPSGMPFDFSYKSRSSPAMVEELGRFICNIVTIVPQGVVVFFASYEYEKRVYDAWTAAGTISKISRKKHVFREPKNSADVEGILSRYKMAIQSCSARSQETGINGALLLAVVGGKISEGINFSDGMGRCVVMVGLPYPSPSDVELIETIKHIETISSSFSVGDNNTSGSNYDDECALQLGYDVLRKCNKGGREYYENLCMKAVNQSIGKCLDV